MDEERQITEEMGKKMADALGCPYFETSAQFDQITEEETKLSGSVISPTEILVKIIEESDRKSTWKMLDELSLPPQGDSVSLLVTAQRRRSRGRRRSRRRRRGWRRCHLGPRFRVRKALVSDPARAFHFHLRRVVGEVVEAHRQAPRLHRPSTFGDQNHRYRLVPLEHSPCPVTDGKMYAPTGRIHVQSRLKTSTSDMDHRRRSGSSPAEHILVKRNEKKVQPKEEKKKKEKVDKKEKKDKKADTKEKKPDSKDKKDKEDKKADSKDKKEKKEKKAETKEKKAETKEKKEEKKDKKVLVVSSEFMWQRMKPKKQHSADDISMLLAQATRFPVESRVRFRNNPGRFELPR